MLFSSFCYFPFIHSYIINFFTFSHLCKLSYVLVVCISSYFSTSFLVFLNKDGWGVIGTCLPFFFFLLILNAIPFICRIRRGRGISDIFFYGLDSVYPFGSFSDKFINSFFGDVKHLNLCF